MDDNLLSNNLKNLYDKYYENDVGRKREIAAADTFEHINDLARENPYKRLLDVGGGEGAVLQRLNDSGFAQEIYVVEISSSGIDAINSRQLSLVREVQAFDGYKIPYDDKTFDLGISIHVLEHVEHERMLLKELKRVAHKVLIEVPLEHSFNLEQSIVAGRPYGHINYYTMASFRNLLETSGLQPKKMKIYTSSRVYETFLYGKTKGIIKHFIRNLALNIAPRIAQSKFTYLGTAFCECDK